jgi:aspartyl protease family protein
MNSEPQWEKAEPAPGQKAGRAMLVFAWIGVLAMLTMVFNVWEDRQNNPNNRPMSYSSDHFREVVLERNRSGHYIVSGLINLQPAIFLLDTGATHVVLSQELADEIGLKRGAAHYAQTANGRVRVYATQLDSVELGSIQLRNVRASINPAMHGKEVLLGMSALKQVEFTQRGTQLTLRQYLHPSERNPHP